MNQGLSRHAYAKARAALIAYLICKVKEADWHAVRDAAVDIEILEAKHKGASL